jgi:hypothetical protein
MTAYRFLDFDFTPLRLGDRGFLTPALGRYAQPLAGYTFAVLAAWNPVYHYSWAVCGHAGLLISCFMEKTGQHHLLQPLGRLGSAGRRRILQGAAALDHPLKIIGVSERFLAGNPDLVREFQVREDRTASNYVYAADALAELKGRKYAKKRNLISQANGLYEWTASPLTAERTDACFAVLEAIAAEESPRVEGMLALELTALEITLKHFRAWEQQGVLVEADGRPVAFSIFEPIGPRTAAIHFKRALRSYKGLYQIINQETAKTIAAQGYERINREEDLGDPGLRAAKKSYHPVEIVPAYELTFKP